MAYIDPTGTIGIIFTAIGNAFEFGTAISSSINEWWDKVGIPEEQRAGVNRRLRRCKWILNHYPKVEVATIVFVKFPDQTPEMRANICEFLKQETNRTT